MPKFEVGSVIAVRSSLSTGYYPALVVDENAGIRWAARYPYIGFVPDRAVKDTHVFVRVLGLRFAELPGARSGLPPDEPRQVEIVNWAFAQEDNSFLIAGPDVESIEVFFYKCQQGTLVGMKDDSGFLSDLEFLIQYLYLSRLKSHGQVDSPKKGSFLAMLEEVLPQV